MHVFFVGMLKHPHPHPTKNQKQFVYVFFLANSGNASFSCQEKWSCTSSPSFISSSNNSFLFWYTLSSWSENKCFDLWASGVNIGNLFVIKVLFYLILFMRYEQLCTQLLGHYLELDISHGKDRVSRPY